MDPVIANGNAAATNFNPFTTDINAVRGQETAYATWNPLTIRNGAGSMKTFDGNLSFGDKGSSSTYGSVISTFSADTGKWYWEITYKQVNPSYGVNSNVYVGILPVEEWNSIKDADVFRDCDSALSLKGSAAYTGTAQETASFVPTINEGDVIGFAMDCDNLVLEVYHNGAYPGAFPYAMASGLTWTPFATDWSNNAGPVSEYAANFGQKPFKFPPPEGFQPLNAANTRPVKVISRPDQYVGVTTYSSNGGTAYTVSGLKFSPNLIMTKNRDNSSGDWNLQDTVRGVTEVLTPNELYASSTQTTNINSITADGFTIGTGSRFNSGTQKICSWVWKAGGNKNTFNVDDVGYASAAAAGITEGTISLTGASIGTRQGFSILKYTATGSNGTLAHGLSQAPDFFFGRDIDEGGTRDWIIYHKGIGNTARLKFNANAKSTSSTFFQDTSPTSSLITIGTSNDINANDASKHDYILYCWHDVPGLQKFGSYEGNGDADGTFVELGFRPILLWRKGIDNNSRGWYITDAIRDASNPVNTFLDASDADADGSGTAVDFLSNGFKLRNADAGTNESETYIYCAWAETPTFNLYGAQSNAR